MALNLSFHRWLLVSALAVAMAIAAGAGLDRVWAQSSPEATATVEVTNVQYLAKGAGIAVALQVSCTGIGEVTFAEHFVSIQQTVGGKQIATGSAGGFTPSIVCDGSPQALPGLVVAPQQGIPFKKGLAILRASIGVCGLVEAGGDYSQSVCANANSASEVRVR